RVQGQQIEGGQATRLDTHAAIRAAREIRHSSLSVSARGNLRICKHGAYSQSVDSIANGAGRYRPKRVTALVGNEFAVTPCRFQQMALGLLTHCQPRPALRGTTKPPATKRERRNLLDSARQKAIYAGEAFRSIGDGRGAPFF